ncbi:MAG: hypothetical protein IJM07_07125 [Pyramidobacter sp.]|nr:hypothetical protein [Pyramidobacter sp.]
MLRIQTVELDWNAFSERFASLMDELLPVLRTIDEDTVAHRTENWSLLPRWDENELVFELYSDDGQNETQYVVSGVPWGTLA